jgi:hypothetical protein
MRYLNEELYCTYPSPCCKYSVAEHTLAVKYRGLGLHHKTFRGCNKLVRLPLAHSNICKLVEWSNLQLVQHLPVLAESTRVDLQFQI